MLFRSCSASRQSGGVTSTMRSIPARINVLTTRCTGDGRLPRPRAGPPGNSNLSMVISIKSNLYKNYHKLRFSNIYKSIIVNRPFRYFNIFLFQAVFFNFFGICPDYKSLQPVHEHNDLQAEIKRFLSLRLMPQLLSATKEEQAPPDEKEQNVFALFTNPEKISLDRRASCRERV